MIGRLKIKKRKAAFSGASQEATIDLEPLFKMLRNVVPERDQKNEPEFEKEVVMEDAQSDKSNVRQTQLEEFKKSGLTTPKTKKFGK